METLTISYRILDTQHEQLRILLMSDQPQKKDIEHIQKMLLSAGFKLTAD